MSRPSSPVRSTPVPDIELAPTTDREQHRQRPVARVAVIEAREIASPQALAITKRQVAHVEEGLPRATRLPSDAEKLLADRLVRQRLTQGVLTCMEQEAAAQAAHAAAAAKVARTREVITHADATIADARTRIARAVSAVGQVARWLWQTAQATVRHRDAAPAHAEAERRLHQGETDVDRAHAREMEAQRRVRETADRIREVHGLLTRASQADEALRTAQQQAEAAEVHCYRERQIVSNAHVAAWMAEGLIERGQQRCERLGRVIAGAAGGLVAYLTRAPQDERQEVLAANQRAQDAGAARRGRTPSASQDEARADAKARRAAKMRDGRRHRQEHALSRSSAPPAQPGSQNKSTRRDGQRRMRAAASMPSDLPIDPRCDGSRPEVRQHEARMQGMAPAQQGAYLAHLLDAREQGRAAAIRDAALIEALPTTTWTAPMAAVPLGRGARLIAVYGSDRVAAISDAIGTDPGAIDRFLAKPGEQRNRAYGSDARLRFLAGHLVAAWGHQLHAMVAAGGLDAALAYEVAQIRARLDLQGHRMLAFLHLDSESGHPHLHVIFSRVRDQDLSLWSVAGRERAPALWLHARSRTVQALGADALPNDVDALAGMSASARGGERLLASDALVIERRAVDGSQTKIPVQGPLAAARIAAVGTCAQLQLAGGIWRFGLGCDPQQMRAWRVALADAKTSGERQRIQEVMKQKPQQRGYWRPMAAIDQAAAFKKTTGYVDYLGRTRS